MPAANLDNQALLNKLSTYGGGLTQSATDTVRDAMNKAVKDGWTFEAGECDGEPTYRMCSPKSAKGLQKRTTSFFYIISKAEYDYATRLEIEQSSIP